jgi:hypothetical protein
MGITNTIPINPTNTIRPSKLCPSAKAEKGMIKRESRVRKRTID